MPKQNFRKLTYPDYKANRVQASRAVFDIYVGPIINGWRALLIDQATESIQEDIHVLSPAYDSGHAMILAEGLKAAVRAKGGTVDRVSICSNVDDVHKAISTSERKLLFVDRHTTGRLLPDSYSQVVKGTVYTFRRLPCEDCDGEGYTRVMGQMDHCWSCSGTGYQYRPRIDIPDEVLAGKCHCGVIVLHPALKVVVSCPNCGCDSWLDYYGCELGNAPQCDGNVHQQG